MSVRPTAGGELVHLSAMYGSRDEFVAKVVPFVEEGLDEHESVLIITSPTNLETLRSALGHRAGRVHFSRSRGWYAKPVEVIGRYMTYLREQLAQGQRSAYIAAEIPWPRNDERLDREWERYEAVVNALFADSPVRFVCLQDTSRLPPSVLEAAEATHPSMLTADGTTAPNHRYMPAEEVLHRMTRDLTTGGRAGRRFGPEDPAPAAGYIADRARRAGLDEHEVRSVAAATIEVLGRSMLHRAPVTVTAWTEGERFVWQIERQGGGQLPASTGFAPAPSDGPDGWGAWIARHLTDTMEIGRGPAGPAVQLTVRRDRVDPVAS